jgi:hypothetical protein
MEKRIDLYKYISILSIDVATGATICAGFFARYFEVFISLKLYTALWLTVWLIYNVDHLLDGGKLKGNAISIRYKWHYENAHNLWPFCILAAIYLLSLVYALPYPIFIAGLQLGIMVIIYFFIAQTNFIRKFIPKEAFVAALYTGGVFLPIYAQLDYYQTDLLAFMFLFFLLAYSNLCTISLIEHSMDESQNMSSISTQFGQKTTSYIIQTLFVLFFVCLMGSAIFFNDRKYYDFVEVLLLMAGLMYLVYWKRKYLIPEEMYRMIGDTVFLLPAFFMMMRDFQ